MVENSRMQDSRIESSMSHLVNEADLTAIAASFTDINNTRDRVSSGITVKGDPMKRLKTSLIKGNPHADDRPNRRGHQFKQIPIKLYISGRNLKNMDIFSKSDPLCVIFERAQDTDEWFEIGRTEFIKDTLNPDFEKAIDIDFFFEKSQWLRFEFIDDDGGDSDDPYYDIIGASTCLLSEVMASKGQTVSKALLVPGKRKQRGMVIVRAEAIKESNH